MGQAQDQEDLVCEIKNIQIIGKKLEIDVDKNIDNVILKKELQIKIPHENVIQQKQEDGKCDVYVEIAGKQLKIVTDEVIENIILKRQSEITFSTDALLFKELKSEGIYDICVEDGGKCYSLEQVDVLKISKYLETNDGEFSYRIFVEKSKVKLQVIRNESYLYINEIITFDTYVRLIVDHCHEERPIGAIAYIGEKSVDIQIQEEQLIIDIPTNTDFLKKGMRDIFIQLKYSSENDVESNHQEQEPILLNIIGKPRYYESEPILKGKYSVYITPNKNNILHIEYARKFRILTRSKTALGKTAFLFIQTFIKPSKRNIIFESFLGKQYSCHPRAIYEYIKEKYPKKYNMVWCVDKNDVEMFKTFGVKYVVRYSLKWFFTMSRAKYWVTNSRLPLWVIKPKKTKYLMTWHGTTVKKLGLDINKVNMPGTNTKKYYRTFYRATRLWDCMVSPNRYMTNIYERCFDIPREKLIEVGSPRNDFLVNNKENEDLVKEIKQRYNIPLDKKVILYAPTYRDNQFLAKGQYVCDSPIDLDLFKEKLSDEYVIILRMHYLISEGLDISGREEYVFNISRGDISELYLISDLLITDYSSVFFDYSVLRRPTLFFMYDIEAYRDELRGFYLDIYQHLPGEIVYNNEELINKILEADNKENPFLDKFIQDFCEFEDGHATEKMVDYFLQQ